MKTAQLIIIISTCFLTFISCKKSHVDSQPKEQLILGKWSINKVELNVFNNGTLIKDSVLPNSPQPENYITFKADGTLEYKYNNSPKDSGTFHFTGSDSVYATIGATQYKWKTLLLTTQIFNVQNTQSYPLLPGATIDTYQTFVR